MYTASEKLAIIRLVEESELSIRRTLREIKVSRTSFYRWYRAYEANGLDGLENQSRAVHQHWNRIPDSVRELIIEVALDRPDLTPRELAWLDHGTTKNGDGRGIPLNSDAVLALRAVEGDHDRWCFTYQGKRMDRVGSGFKRALKRVGITDFRFHDLRHTWAS